ncbi:hypothetical protein C0991_010062 [Blastosporella zonata]|nr:hypothetical protein C0991_010062 [Blastosporella zonata]
MNTKRCFGCCQLFKVNVQDQFDHSNAGASGLGTKELFAQNKEGLQVSAWATYGRVVQTLRPGEGDEILPTLADPPLVIAEADIDVIKKVARNVSAAMVAARDCVSLSCMFLRLRIKFLQFVMGDFWPGNIMITMDDEQKLRKVYIFDWELAKPGLPGIEIGQFCAEVHLVRQYVPAAEKFASTILNTFLRAYAEQAKPDILVARNALMHWGTHLAVWTPRVDTWSEDKDKTRSVVEEGVQLIVKAVEASEQSLSESFVGPLVKS